MFWAQAPDKACLSEGAVSSRHVSLHAELAATASNTSQAEYPPWAIAISKLMHLRWLLRNGIESDGTSTQQRDLWRQCEQDISAYVAANLTSGYALWQGGAGLQVSAMQRPLCHGSNLGYQLC